MQQFRVCLGRTESHDRGEDVGGDGEGRRRGYGAVFLFPSFLISFQYYFSIFSMVFPSFYSLFVLLYSGGHSLSIHDVYTVGLLADVVTCHKGHLD